MQFGHQARTVFEGTEAIKVVVEKELVEEPECSRPDMSACVVSLGVHMKHDSWWSFKIRNMSAEGGNKHQS
jgi:hypothetical protein